MAKIRNDFKVQPNTQNNRTQEDLWDVVVGGKRFTTTTGKENAEKLATALNEDPWHMERGQTRADRYGVNITVDRDD